MVGPPRQRAPRRTAAIAATSRAKALQTPVSVCPMSTARRSAAARREGRTGEGGFRLARTGDPAGDGERRHEGGEDQQHRRPGRVPGFQAQPEMQADDRVQPDDHEQQRLLEGGIRPQAAQYDIVGVVAAVEAAVAGASPRHAWRRAAGWRGRGRSAPPPTEPCARCGGGPASRRQGRYGRRQPHRAGACPARSARPRRAWSAPPPWRAGRHARARG